MELVTSDAAARITRPSTLHSVLSPVRKFFNQKRMSAGSKFTYEQYVEKGGPQKNERLTPV